jgi:hypothetical protein
VSAAAGGAAGLPARPRVIAAAELALAAAALLQLLSDTRSSR